MLLSRELQKLSFRSKKTVHVRSSLFLFAVSAEQYKLENRPAGRQIVIWPFPVPSFNPLSATVYIYATLKRRTKNEIFSVVNH